MRIAAVAERVADMPPGPELAAALAGLEPARIPNAQIVDVLRAQARQLAHEQARLLKCLLEVGRADPHDLHGARRLPAPGEWAGGEIAAALTLTGVAADRELDFAETLITRLPLVHAALSVGSIDRAKAWVFADHLQDTTAAQSAVICAALVPLASGLTTGQLRARLARMLHDIDHARRRYRRAVRDRGVVGYLQPDGTVSVTASGLPTDEAAVACERLDDLAHAGNALVIRDGSARSRPICSWACSTAPSTTTPSPRSSTPCSGIRARRTPIPATRRSPMPPLTPARAAPPTWRRPPSRRAGASTVAAQPETRSSLPPTSHLTAPRGPGWRFAWGSVP
jgi:hypothetical protein